jgi:hypothetical protein
MGAGLDCLNQRKTMAMIIAPKNMPATSQLILSLSICNLIVHHNPNLYSGDAATTEWLSQMSLEPVTL